MKWYCAAIFLAVLMPSSPSSGHEDNAEDGDHFFSCEAYISREEIEVPNLESPRWIFLKKIGKHHPLSFYRDSQTPDVAVSAVIVHGERSGVPFTQTTWQVGSKIYKFLIYGGIEELICISEIPQYNGFLFTIEEFMRLLEERLPKERPSEPST